MNQSKTNSSWDSLAGDLFRRAFSFGLSAFQLTHVATALAVHRNENDVDRAVYNGAHSPAIWFLAHFAFELFLKSAIAAKGRNPAEIKAIGHDLEKALEGAEALGLGINESTRLSIKIANRAHKRDGENAFFFRYGGSAKADVETVEALVASLKDLLEQTRVLVNEPQISYERFLVPFENAEEQ